MSKSGAVAAAQSSKDAGGDAANPYGTRSRNRNGNSRINYAEDTGEMDFEYTNSATDGKKSSRNRNSSPNTNALETPSVTPASSRNSNSRKSGSGTNGESNGRTLHQESIRDHLVSTASTPNSAAEKSSSQPPSKKRKTGHTNNVSTTSVPTNPQHAKRAQAIVQNGNSRPQVTYADTNMMSFTKSKALLEDDCLVADDGTELRQNDHIYLVSEPPGEPYYLGRIMEFMHAGNDNSRPIDAIRVNWYYRPKDIGKRVQDTRLLLATMHSDVSPLSAVRGKCQIKHKSEIPSMEEYKKTPDSFWYEKLYDRYIQKHYDLIPTAQIINVPDKVKRVLDEHWKFVLVEQGRGRELTAAVKLCRKCGCFCASNDSVDCSDCKITWHMNCVNPPVTKKPSRGFGWSCAPCSRRHEKMINARHTPAFGNTPEMDEDDIVDEEEEPTANDASRDTPVSVEESRQEPTPEQKQQASLWPFRYLGAHCKVEDALDLDDRIYPRTSTRIGPRHQATVLPWPGRPVEYEKPLELKKPGRREPRLTKEQLAEFEAKKLERENRPAWLQDEPPGWTVRGEDFDNDDPRCTATLLWKPPSEDEISSARLTSFMNDARDLCSTVGVPENSTNLQDVALNALFTTGLDTKKALQITRDTPLEDFKEPPLNQAEMKKFEEGVSKYGSELGLVSRHVKTVEHKHIVRLYYTWKKTARGKEVWGNYAGRKGKKEAKAAAKTAAKLQDDIADDVDDSAYDCDKAVQQKRTFMCKFCHTKKSRQWRRAPSGGSNEGGKIVKDKNGQHIVALCRRCAELWRRYAIQWEDLEEVAKKIAQSGGRAWKRKQDEELLKELVFAKDIRSPEAPVATTNGSVPKASVPNGNNEQPPRKKLKSGADDKSVESSPAPSVQSKKKDKEKEKDKDKEKEKEKEREKDKATPVPEKATPAAPAVAAIPEIPKPRRQPCAVCSELDDHIIVCKECRLPVHASCYGVLDRSAAKASKGGRWTCETCINDRNPQVSLDYHCVLCSVDKTEYDFVGVPEKGNRKKEKERDRQERDQARKTADYYEKKQEESGRPVNPREALKRTADNNWVHVTCASLMPEIQFGNADVLAPAEGVGSIPRAKFERVCSICNKHTGACVDCEGCNQSFHVECARRKPKEYFVGFAVSSVKSSRRTYHTVVTVNGETGSMTPLVWCLAHDAANAPHSSGSNSSRLGLHDHVKESNQSALQFYASNYKQADMKLTGTVRKANLISSIARGVAAAGGVGAGAGGHGRRASTASVTGPVAAGPAKTTTATTTTTAASTANAGASANGTSEKESEVKVCIACGIDVSPKWWPIDDALKKELELQQQDAPPVGAEAKKFVEQRKFRCHKCEKFNRLPQKNVPEPPAAEVIPMEITPPPPPPPQQQQQQQQPQQPPQPVQPVQASVSASAMAPQQPSLYAVPPVPPVSNSSMPIGVSVNLAMDRPPPLASPRVAPPPHVSQVQPQQQAPPPPPPPSASVAQPQPAVDTHRPFQMWAPPSAPVYRPASNSPTTNAPMSRDRPYYPINMPPFSNDWKNEYRSAHRNDPVHRNDSVHRSEPTPMHSQRYADPAPPPPPQQQQQQPSQQPSQQSAPTPMTLTSLRPPPLPIPQSQQPTMSHQSSPYGPTSSMNSMPPAPSYHHSYGHASAPLHRHTHHTHSALGSHLHSHSHHLHSHTHSSHSHVHSGHSHHPQHQAQHHHSPHGSLSGPVQQAPMRPDILSLHPQRPPPYMAHHSPPLAREPYGMYGQQQRDRAPSGGPGQGQQQQPQGPPPPQVRPPSGHSANASISPSLKNLLS